MSYYSHYTLTWDDTLPEPTIAAIVAQWRSERPDVAYCMDADGEAEERSTWYNRVEDLTELSKRAPTVLFTLDCLGEDGARIRFVASNGRVFRIKPRIFWARTPISPESHSDE
ncbi:MAG: hypothetical protein HOO67_03295 [Candidatus Peribacteraceae bacterium]|nr:hypothetical protein [Candidatus Peribacteraceae bacterium]